MSLRADMYRQKAAEAKQSAAQAKNQSMKRAFEEISARYLVLAEQMEWMDSQKASAAPPDKFESLDANEKAALESTLYRCRALVGRIGEELRKKKPDDFVDERSLEDLHASLEHAAWVLEQKTAKG
jgi:hypothetical protein